MTARLGAVGRGQLAVAITCAIAAVCFAGAVTERALFGFVLPGLALGAASAAVFAAHRQLRAAAITGLVVAVVWSEVANVLTGQSNGPAARSSFAAAGFAALAITATASRFPALFLAPVGGIVVAAALLGAGGEVRVVAMATVGVAVVALAIVESAHRRWTRPSGGPRPSRRWSVVVLALLVMVAAALAAVTQARHDPRGPHTALAGSHNSLVKPPWQDPFPATTAPGKRTSHRSVAPPPIVPVRHNHHRHHHRQHPKHHRTKVHHRQQVLRHQLVPPLHHQVPRQHHQRHVAHHHRLIDILLLALLMLLVFALLVLGVRLVAVRMSWRRIRKGLRAASVEGVVGAWVWARLRFRAYRIPLPAQLSPDLVDRGGISHEVPPNTAGPLGELSRLVTPAAFAADPVVTDDDLEAAWQLSDDACAAAEDSLSRLGHLRLRVASPPRDLVSRG